MDSIGKRGISDKADYWYGPVINSWLAFLDGATPLNGIVVIGATNFPDRVDDAMKRPGRLEKHVVIPRPTIDDLKGVIMHQLGAGALDDGLDSAAKACRGRSPADISQYAREARRIARAVKRQVCAGDVTDVLYMNRDVRSADLDLMIAYHEAGHALAAYLQGVNVKAVDLDALFTLYESIRGEATRADIEKHLVVKMAGRVANRLYSRGETMGANEDLAQASALAFAAVTRLAFDGYLIVLPETVATADECIRQRVESMLKTADETAEALLTVHEPELTALTQALLKERYLDTAEIDAVIKAVKKERKFRRESGFN